MIKAGAIAEPRFTKKALVPMCTEVRLGVIWYADEILKIAMSPGIPRGKQAEVLEGGESVFGVTVVHKAMQLEGHVKVNVSPALVFQLPDRWRNVFADAKARRHTISEDVA